MNNFIFSNYLKFINAFKSAKILPKSNKFKTRTGNLKFLCSQFKFRMPISRVGQAVAAINQSNYIVLEIASNCPETEPRDLSS